MNLTILAQTLDTIEAANDNATGNASHSFPPTLRDDLEHLTNRTPARTPAERAWRINRLARAVENEWCDEWLSPLASATIRDAQPNASSEDTAELVRFMDGLDPDVVGPIPAAVVRALAAAAKGLNRLN